MPKFPLPAQVAVGADAAKVSVAPFVNVIVALVNVCVPVPVQVEQMVDAFSGPLNVTVAVSPEPTCPLPLVRATAVGAVCVGVAKVKTALVWVAPCVACAKYVVL